MTTRGLISYFARYFCLRWLGYKRT